MTCALQTGQCSMGPLADAQVHSPKNMHMGGGTCGQPASPLPTQTHSQHCGPHDHHVHKPQWARIHDPICKRRMQPRRRHRYIVTHPSTMLGECLCRAMRPAAAHGMAQPYALNFAPGSQLACAGLDPRINQCLSHVLRSAAVPVGRYTHNIAGHGAPLTSHTASSRPTSQTSLLPQQQNSRQQQTRTNTTRDTQGGNISRCSHGHRRIVCQPTQ